MPPRDRTSPHDRRGGTGPFYREGRTERSIWSSAATIEPSEPQPQDCRPDDRSVWYRITATRSGTLAADASSATADSQLVVYHVDGAGIGGLTFVRCQYFGRRVDFDVEAGETYYMQASTSNQSSGSVRVHVEALAPPPNDDFGSATAVGALPFSQSTNLNAATAQTDDPAT